MNREDQDIKPFMQILLGIGLFILYKTLDRPIQIITKWKHTNWHDPADELFLHFVSWLSLTASIFFIFFGIAELTKRYIKSNEIS